MIVYCSTGDTSLRDFYIPIDFGFTNMHSKLSKKNRNALIKLEMGYFFCTKGWTKSKRLFHADVSSKKTNKGILLYN